MSVAEFPPRITESPAQLDRAEPRSRRSVLTLEQGAYLLLFAVALLAHLWGLGNRALHHDETHHAFYSWKIYTGQGYVHDPLLHGPFLYFVNALVYFLFGDSNFTARISVALFGSVLVTLPYLIRREIGRGAALLAAVYLLLSPTFLYVGRFIRHDMFAVTFELLVFIGIVRYASTRKARWLYLVAAALGFMMVTLETFFLYLAIMAPLVVGLFLWRVWKPGILVAGAIGLLLIGLVFKAPGTPLPSVTGGTVQRANGPYVCPSPGNLRPPDNPMLFSPGLIPGLPPLATADNDYGVCVRNQPDNSFAAYFVKLGQFFGHPAILAGIAVLLIGGGLLSWRIWRRRGPDGLTIWQRARARDDETVWAFASLGRGSRVAIALSIFISIYSLFFSAFLTNPVGLVSGATGSVLYWLAQQEVKRGGQPGYYYTILLSVYEPLALIWSVVGLGVVGGMLGRRAARWLTRRRDGQAAQPPGSGPLNWSFALPAMLAWWAVMTFAIYSWAGEKMPWLTVHVTLPLALLGAWALARTLGWGLERNRAPAATHLRNSDEQGREIDSSALIEPASYRTRAVLIYLAFFGVTATFTFLLLSVLTKTPNGFAPWVFPLAILIVAVISLCYGLARGARETIGVLALAITLAGTIYTARSAYQINYRWGDTPREMLIFVQTSPDVARVMERLEQASIRRTGGLGMPIWYDNETIWGWYTRRFTNKQQQQPALVNPPGDEVMAVLMLQENLDNYPQNRQNLQGFLIQRYPLRWWFPEEAYRLPSNWATSPVSENSPLLMRLLRTPFDAQTVAQFWQYMIYRQTPGVLGSTDFVLAIRPELADEIGLGTGAEK